MRTLLSWRWAALTLLLVAAVVAMVLLGRWQWDRSAAMEVAAPVDLTTVQPAALPDVLDVVGVGERVAQQQSGELVRVTGRWAEDRTLLVADRDLDGRAGRWVLSGLRTDTPAGPVVVPVVRGWVPLPVGSAGTSAEATAVDPAAVQAATADQLASLALPPGEVVVLGWLQASEPLDLPIRVVQPDGVVPLVSTPDLVNRWPDRLGGGFVVTAPTPDQLAVTAAVSAEGGDAVPQLLPAPPEQETRTRDWRNLAYSAQWFVFAGFAVALWWRMLRDDVARREAAQEAEAAAALAPPPDTVPTDRTTERTTT